MRRNFLTLFISMIFIGISGRVCMAQSALPIQRLEIRKADGGLVIIDAELATQPEDIAYGLMNRTEMPESAGMLFFFPEDALRSFWMKNTLIPLDMLFISSDGVINHIHQNAKPMDLTPIPSNGDARAVLELNGGASERMGIKEGDIISHSLFTHSTEVE